MSNFSTDPHLPVDAPASSKRQLLGLLLFFGLSYLLMFCTVLGRAWGWFEVPGAIYVLLSVGSPTVAAVIVLAVFEGRAGLAGLLVQYVRFRAAWRWYVLCLIFFVIPLAYGLGKWLAVGAPALDMRLGALPGLLLITFIMGPLSEEGGWRGYALPRMLELMGPVTASVILGLLWGAWHLPFWFVPGSYQQDIPFLGYVVAAAILSVVYTQVYLAAGRSLTICIFLHFCINLAGALLMRRWQLLTLVEFLVIELVLVVLIGGYYALRGLPASRPRGNRSDPIENARFI